MGKMKVGRYDGDEYLVREGFFIHRCTGQKGDFLDFTEHKLIPDRTDPYDSWFSCFAVKGEAEVLKKDGSTHPEGRIPNGHYWQKRWDGAPKRVTAVSDDAFVYWCLMPAIPPTMWERQLYDVPQGNTFIVAPKDKVQYVFIGDGSVTFEGQTYEAGKLIKINPGQSATVVCNQQVLLLHLWEE